MMSSKVDPSRVLADHVATLRDHATNKVRPSELAVHYGLPVAFGVAVPIFGIRLTDAGQIIAGAAVLAGFSFGLSVFVFQLRMEAARDPRVPRGSLLLDLIDELFTNVLYSIVVGLALTVFTVVATTVQPEGVTRLNSWWTGIIAGVGLHYLLTLAMCVKRMRAAYRQLSI